MGSSKVDPAAAEAEKKAGSSSDAADSNVSPENGPRGFRKRGCTDICCVVIFVACFVALFFVTFLAWTYGEPHSILYGKDYLGHRCGVGNYANRSKTIYPRIDQDLLQQAAIASSQPWRLVFYGLCVSHCPNITDPTECIADPDRCIVRDYGSRAQWQAAGGSSYYFQVLPTMDLMNRCIPKKAVSASTVPDRCAYPVCDGVTMVCDPEMPNLWVLNSLSDRLRCEVKFQHVEVDQFATMTPSPLTAKIADKMAFIQRLVTGMFSAQTEIMLLGLVAPIILGVAWLVLLRLFAKTIVYTAIVAIGLGLALLTLYLFVTTGALDSALDQLASNRTGFGSAGNASFDSDSVLGGALSSAQSSVVTLAPDELTAASESMSTGNPFLYRLAAWVLLLLTVIYLIVMCLARKKIRLAATLVKESTIIVKERASSLLFPFVIIAAQIPIVLYFFFVLILLGTADLQLSYFISGADGIVSASSSYADAMKAVNVSSLANGGLPPDDPWWVPSAIYLYFLFCVLWALESVKNIGWTALSGNVSDWYFFRRDEKMRTRFPLFSSLYRVLRYHLGSIFFGSFVIAIIQLVRIVMQIIDQQTQKLQDGNKLLKLAMKGVQCCMWCFEKTVKFISNYCYIYVAMQGSGFCKSCFATFSLIISHPAQLALNTMVRNILTLIQLLGIPSLCGWLCHRVLVGALKPEPLYPSALVFLMAFIIMQAFALVMSCALDTLFVCCVRDKAEYKGAFMSDRLYAAFGFDKSDRKERRATRRAERERLAAEAPAPGE